MGCCKSKNKKSQSNIDPHESPESSPEATSSKPQLLSVPPELSSSPSIESKLGSNCKQPPLQHKDSAFKLHIAIDFGTDGCGLAFAYNGKVQIYNKWKGQKRKKKNSKANPKRKTKTQLILNAKNEVSCFGNAAKYTYRNLTKKGKEELKFFERFKMALYETDLTQSSIITAEKDDESKSRNEIEVKTAKYLVAANGDRVLSEVVFIAAFQALQKLSKEYIPNNITKDNISDDEIQWILTVPAIWSESAKAKMKKWIIKAGLVSAKIPNQCVIVYEPDCASLSIQKQHFKDFSKKSQGITRSDHDDEKKEDDDTDRFQKGDKYVLIDAGGGTVDIACHEVQNDGSVEEIVYPTGNKWGSCYIDDLYITLLHQIFGKQWMNQLKEYVDIMENFQESKATFYKKSDETTHCIQFPDDFMGFLEQECDKIDSSPKQKVNEFAKSKELKYYKSLFFEKEEDGEYDEEGQESGVCILELIKEREGDDDDDEDELDEDEYDYNYYLKMDIKIWKCLFDSKINPIISHVEGLLTQDTMRDCKYLGLVGGFSSSKYLQYRMKQQFGIESGHKLKVIIPKKPMLSVVEGAAHMAITKDYISARKLRYTYGQSLYYKVEKAKEVGISDEYIKNHTSADGLVQDCFDVLVRKNERVAIGHPIQKTSYGRSVRQEIPILFSDKYNPKVDDDGEKLATLEVRHADQSKVTVTELDFSGTMFKVYAYPKANPKARQEIEIKYGT